MSKKLPLLKIYRAALEQKLELKQFEEERSYGGYLKVKYNIITSEIVRYGEMYHPRLFAWKIDEQ